MPQPAQPWTWLCCSPDPFSSAMWRSLRQRRSAAAPEVSERLQPEAVEALLARVERGVLPTPLHRAEPDHQDTGTPAAEPAVTGDPRPLHGRTSPFSAGRDSRSGGLAVGSAGPELERQAPVAYLAQPSTARSQWPGAEGAVHGHLLAGPESGEIRKGRGGRGRDAHLPPSVRSSAQTSLPQGRLSKPCRS